MLETLIIVILIVWLAGSLGEGEEAAEEWVRWAGGNLIHVLLVIVLILLLIRFLH